MDESTQPAGTTDASAALAGVADLVGAPAGVAAAAGAGGGGAGDGGPAAAGAGGAGAGAAGRRGRRARRPRRRAVWLGAGAAAAIAAGALTWSLWPVQDLDTHTVLGVEVTTNLEVAAHGGYIYVTVPVNADASEAVLHVPDEGDNLRIREFLDGLDTLVPGEHVLALSEANLHFIVDGIEE